MNALTLRRLKDFCRKNDIDTEFIDNSLTYQENLSALQKMVQPSDLLERATTDKQTMREIQDLVDTFDYVPLYQQYGISEMDIVNAEIPIVFFNFYFKVPYRLYGLTKLRLNATKFKKTVTWYGKFYLKVTGTKAELLDAVSVLPNGVVLFKYDKPYVNTQIFTGKKWLILSEAPVLKTLYH